VRSAVPVGSWCAWILAGVERTGRRPCWPRRPALFSRRMALRGPSCFGKRAAGPSLTGGSRRLAALHFLRLHDLADVGAGGRRSFRCGGGVGVGEPGEVDGRVGAAGRVTRVPAAWLLDGVLELLAGVGWRVVKDHCHSAAAHPEDEDFGLLPVRSITVHHRLYRFRCERQRPTLGGGWRCLDVRLARCGRTLRFGGPGRYAIGRSSVPLRRSTCGLRTVIPG
jgi:hypothetical protein